MYTGEGVAKRPDGTMGGREFSVANPQKSYLLSDLKNGTDYHVILMDGEVEARN